MEKPVRIILYGNSLFLQGISRSLEAAPWLGVVHVQPGIPDAGLPDDVSGACLLVFDVQEAPPELMPALFKEIPHLGLLALDPESDRLLVLSSQVSNARTTGDLMEVIRSYRDGSQRT